MDVWPAHRHADGRAMMDTTACVTGHRPNRLGGYDPNHPLRQKVRLALRVRLHEAVALGFRTFISGMALGVDQDFAEIVLEFRAARLAEGIRLIAAVPFRGQDERWPAASQRRYRGLLALADEVVTISGGGFAASKLQVRSQWMVDHSRLVIAVWDGTTTGGTYRTVKYAEEQRRLVWRINPKEL